MILTCPECATSYFVDDSKIGPTGRSVRCANCGARWTARNEPELELRSTPEEGALAVDPAVDALEQVGDLPAEALPKVFRARAQAKRNVKAAAASGIVWSIVLVLFVMLIAAAYVFRAEVVRAWPKTASLYAWLHVPVNPTGLELEGVGAQPALKDGHAALMVSGMIRNIRNQPVDSPALKIMLFDAAGKQVAAKIADPENARIPPGETRHFLVSVLDPPTAAQSVQVEFVLGRKAPMRAVGPAAKPAEAVQLRGAVETTPADAAAGWEPVEARPMPIGPISPVPEPPAAPPAGATPRTEKHG